MTDDLDSWFANNVNPADVWRRADQNMARLHADMIYQPTHEERLAIHRAAETARFEANLQEERERLRLGEIAQTEAAEEETRKRRIREGNIQR